MLLNGVRKSAIANYCAIDERDKSMVVSLRESVQLISDPGSLDSSVEEVFEMMLGLRCKRVSQLPVPSEAQSVTAVVGYGGVLSGACVFRCGGHAALKITGQMTGTTFDSIDDTVKDGVGELCNMLAGAWKGKVPELAANCGLSVPAVITGQDYQLHVQAPEFQLHHVYRFDDTMFEVTIVCDGLQ